MKKAILILLMATSLALVGAGVSCSGASTKTLPPEINKATPPEIDKQAPDFMITTLAGKTAALSDYKGKKVLLNFWAVTCDQCNMERDLLEAVHSEYPEIQIMMVNSKDDIGTVRQFVRNVRYTLPIYMDEERIAAVTYDVYLIPKTFLINGDGIIKYIQDGAFSDRTQLENALKSL
jgi:peroxiredoxin